MTSVPIELPDEPGWSTVSVGAIHVLVRAGGALVERVRSAAQSGDLDEVLDALAADGVRATPDFAAVLEGSPPRVVTRGSAYAVQSGPAGSSELRASGRGPWADQDGAEDATGFALHTGTSGPPAPAPEPSSATAPAAAPAPTAAPDATTPPAEEPSSGGGAGWRLPSVFGRSRDTAAAAQSDLQPADRPGETMAGESAAPAGTDDPAGHTDADGEVGEVEELPSYDHLFGATQHDRPSYIEKHDTQGIHEPPIGHAPIESAGGFDPRDAVGSPEHTLAPPTDTVHPRSSQAGQGSQSGQSVPTSPAVAPPAPQGQPAQSSPAPPRSGLIDSVPWRSGGSNVPAPDPAPSSAASPSSPAPAPAAPAPQPDRGAHAPPTPVPPSPPAAPYQARSGAVPLPPATASAPPVSSVPPVPTSPPAPAPASAAASAPAIPPAPSRPSAPPPAAAAPASATPTTSMPAAQSAAQATTTGGASSHAASGASGASDEPDDSDATVDRSALLAGQPTVSGPTVLAVLCPAGHTSPPHSATCRLCGRDIPPQQPFATARPVLGLLRLASGDIVQLDRGVLLGRSPKVNADLSAAERPHLVRVTSPQNDISRNHVEIVLEGWHVLIRDLGSTNGTTVALPGQHPVRLRPSDQQVIEPGTVITLADEVSLTYEVGS